MKIVGVMLAVITVIAELMMLGIILKKPDEETQ